MKEYIKEKRWIHYLFIIVVGLLVSIPLFWLQIKSTDDGFIHLTRIMGLGKSVAEGDFPFLVYPNLCRNFGYSMTAFYPPIVTYIPYIFSIISNSFINGLKIFSALTIILSGIFMYNLVNEFTKNKIIALLSGLVYMIFPYRFENIYNRFAIGEFTVFVFIPILFQGIHNLLNGDKSKHYYITIGTVGIILSHTISTVFTALFAFVYVLLNIDKVCNKEVIKKGVINLIFILLMVAMFIVPMLEFKMSADYAIFNTDIMKTNGKYTSKNAIEPWQFLKDKNQENGVSFIIGVPMVFMLATTIIAFKDIDKKYKNEYIVFGILGIISMIMCTKFFPWKYMLNIFNTIQYPWRMLGFALFFFAPVCAINMYTLINSVKKEMIQNILYIFLIIIIGVFTFRELTVYKTENRNMDKEYVKWLEDSNLVTSHFSINRDYLPVGSIFQQFSYFNNREDRVYVLKGNTVILNENKDELYLEFDISKAEKDAILELPYVFYPGYTVILKNGSEEVKLDTFDSSTGFLSIEIPEDIQEGKITVEYTGTLVEKAAYIVSAISSIVFIIYIIYFKNKIKSGEANEGKN